MNDPDPRTGEGDVVRVGYPIPDRHPIRPVMALAIAVAACLAWILYGGYPNWISFEGYPSICAQQRRTAPANQIPNLS